MAPELVEEFVRAFQKECNQQRRDEDQLHEAKKRELEEVVRKLNGLIDAIAEGLRAPGLQQRLTELEARRAQLEEGMAAAAAPPVRLHPNLALKALYQLGLTLMDRADKADLATKISRALLYRDGLIIALLATDPLRLANITSLEIGRTLIKNGATWSFNIPAEETKVGRAHLAILPHWSVARIDLYVDRYRPMFRNAEATSRLWLSRIGRPLHYDSLYRLVCNRTREAFGKAINPHLFRSCLTTSTAVHHGANMGLAMTVLGHQSSKVTTRHYNQAKMIDAVRAYQEVLLTEPEDQEQ